MAPELTPEQLRKIDDLLAAGSKIQAIKVYREATGLGLKEAKEAIDDVAAELARRAPGKYPEARKGCALLLIAGGAMVAGGLAAAAYLV